MGERCPPPLHQAIHVSARDVVDWRSYRGESCAFSQKSKISNLILSFPYLPPFHLFSSLGTSNLQRTCRIFASPFADHSLSLFRSGLPIRFWCNGYNFINVVTNSFCTQDKQAPLLLTREIANFSALDEMEPGDSVRIPFLGTSHYPPNSNYQLVI